MRPILVMKLLFECMYGQHFQQSMDQPGMVANPVRGELNSENNFSLSLFALEKLASRDRFGRPVPRQPPQVESGAYSRDSSRLTRRCPHIYTTNRHRVSPEFIGARSCVPIAFTTESPPAQGQLSSG